MEEGSLPFTRDGGRELAAIHPARGAAQGEQGSRRGNSGLLPPGRTLRVRVIPSSPPICRAALGSRGLLCLFAAAALVA